MEENKKYYTRSNGEQIDLSVMNTEHIINAIGKYQREMFNSTSKDDFSNKLKVVNDLKNEYYLRLNKFYETLGDSDGE